MFMRALCVIFSLALVMSFSLPESFSSARDLSIISTQQNASLAAEEIALNGFSGLQVVISTPDFSTIGNAGVGSCGSSANISLVLKSLNSSQLWQCNFDLFKDVSSRPLGDVFSKLSVSSEMFMGSVSVLPIGGLAFVDGFNSSNDFPSLAFVLPSQPQNGYVNILLFLSLMVFVGSKSFKYFSKTQLISFNNLSFLMIRRC